MNPTLGLFEGENVFIRTVIFFYTGRLCSYDDKFIVLEDAAWIADTGFWAEALTTGKLNEVEPYPDGKILVSLGTVVDISLWTHDLPRTRK